MSHYVECTLQITGAPDIVSDCLSSMGSPEDEQENTQLFDFDRVIPLPPDLRARLEAPSPIGAEEWADTVSELWGTGWACDVTVERQPDGGGALIQFETRWAPPRPVIVALADRFPSHEFDFTYFDVETPIAGRARRAPGEGWATIEARCDFGFCRTAVEARRWDPSGEAQPPQEVWPAGP